MVRAMTSEELRGLFTAEPDPEYYKHRGTIKTGDILELEIYIQGEEHVEEDGSYFRISTEQGEVYISREIIEKLHSMIHGGDELLDF